MSSDYGFLDPSLPGGSNENAAKTVWEKLTNGTSKEDFLTIYENIGQLYWAGVAQEVSAAIVALAEFEQHQPDALPDEEYQPEQLKTDHLTGLVDLWNPFVSNSPLNTHIPSLKARVESTVREEVEYLPLQERRAQAMLQALGLMDIDFVQERRRPTFRSLGQRPQIKTSVDEYIHVAIQCSHCRHCVRAFHYFECTKGCIDNPDQVNMFSIPQRDENPDSANHYAHGIIVSDSMQTSPYVLCPPCFELKSPHPLDHLQAVRCFPKGQLANSKSAEFARRLDAWEDQLDGRFLMGFGALTIDRIASGSSILSRTSTRHVFPAGNSHCAVMFGPLIIENGTKYMEHGARISRRNAPNFTTLSSEHLRDFISSDAQFIWSDEDEREYMVSKHLAISQDRHLHQGVYNYEERRFMSTQKQVAGGLFTCSCPKFSLAEGEIIRTLVYASEVWRNVSTNPENRNIVEHRATLRSCAIDIVEIVKDTFEVEIKKFLYCITLRLQKTVKIKYDRVFNNCQDFSSAMLFNKDEWDGHFGGVYPIIPPSQDQTPDTLTMRYMMSFAGRMQHKEFFVSPLMSSTQLYSSFGHNDSDIIDHAINVRIHSPFGFGIAESHEEYLIKNHDMTCNGKDHCTMADHLLDGPHDNLSVLTAHIHRKRNIYTVPTPKSRHEELLSSKGPSEWIKNRLNILLRLRLLNSYLGNLAGQWGNLVADITEYKELRSIWQPVDTRLGRCWTYNKREGRNILKPTWFDDLYKTKHLNNARWMLMSTTMHTSPDIQAEQAWQARYMHLKSQLFSESKKKPGSSIIPRGTCDCSSCELIWAARLCSRAARHAASQQSVPAEDRAKAYLTSHPDHVPLDHLVYSMRLLTSKEKAVTDCLKQLTRTPEYLGREKSTELLIEMFPDSFAYYHGVILRRPGQEHLPFLEWLRLVHDEGDA